MDVEAVIDVETFEPRSANGSPFVRWLKLVWNLLFAVVAVLVICAAAIYAGMQFVGYRLYDVTSTSMVPTFGKGDVVSARATPAHEIAVGDIILYKRDGYTQPIVHRVTRIRSDPDVHSVVRDKTGDVIRDSWAYSPRTFWAQGDANTVEDALPINESQVIGTERFVVPPPLNLIVTKFDRSLLIWFAGGAILLFVTLEMLDMVKIVLRRRSSASATPPADEAQVG
ncbi:MAG: signal peptidase I [Anaerolinea sp.]|nr:signal peptidase I [Anaerolinea sp.]